MNAAAVSAFSAQAAAAGAALWPAVIVLGDGSTEIPACVPEPRFTADISMGVEETIGSLAARVKLSDLPARPAANQQLRWKRPEETEYRPQVWWIDAVKASPLDVEWHLQCSPRN